MYPAPRTPEQRKKDTLARFATEVDAWVATAGKDGDVYLTPLSYHWNGATFTMATAEQTTTARNLRTAGEVRLAFGETRDVVLVHGVVEAFSEEAVPLKLADDFVAEVLWDPRGGTNPYAFFQVTPRRIQAWREENELDGRDLMKDGVWLV
ncbi:pyridoxamine 5'-phosphate oxidase family protein [Actinopolymorpha alba]|uniref:pyridoxamine 5'-phosphate oxidase family protein n=1 Tax=Actinopolymorpha alba TaxID=533267 RepID=UPI00036C05E2|nr:pyridoxamine 5'-phosphate oxidase family protein [Actinopolymorpha alba]